MDKAAFSRELLQAKLLIALMSQSLEQELVLKGGLAMRAVLGSTRYTTDIDLDAVTNASSARVEGIVGRAIKSVLGQGGLVDEATVTQPKKTETTLRWKILGKAPGSQQPVHLTVEVSRRPWAASFGTVQRQLNEDFAGGAVKGLVLALDAQAMAVCKVLALTDPVREAPRDLYDLGVLLDVPLKDPADLLQELPSVRLEQALAELWLKIERMGYARFLEEVLPYLPPQAAAVVDEDAYADMQVAWPKL